LLGQGHRCWALYLLGNLRAGGSHSEQHLARAAYRDGMDLAKQLGMLTDVGQQERRDQVDIAARMFREMGMECWVEKAEAGLKTF
jgi:hypothetical protein